MDKLERTKSELDKFIKDTRKEYEENEIIMFEALEDCYKESFTNTGLSGFTTRLYIGDDGYSIAENMGQGTTTMANYEDREICALTIPTCQEIDDICDDCLHNIIVHGHSINKNIEDKVDELKARLAEDKECDIEDIEEWKIIDEMNSELKAEYNSIRMDYYNEAMQESWDNIVYYYKDKIQEAIEDYYNYMIDTVIEE